MATFSEKEFIRACRVNRPTELAVTFADYLDWKIHEKKRISRKVENFMDWLEALSGGIPVTLVKTGPETVIDYDWYRRSMIRKMS